jgi:hypothetical protein
VAADVYGCGGAADASFAKFNFEGIKSALLSIDKRNFGSTPGEQPAYFLTDAAGCTRDCYDKFTRSHWVEYLLAGRLPQTVSPVSTMAVN